MEDGGRRLAEEGVTLWFKDKGLDKPINVGWVNTQFNCLPLNRHRSSAYNKGPNRRAAGVTWALWSSLTLTA
jgi:hypothetical protein